MSVVDPWSALGSGVRADALSAAWLQLLARRLGPGALAGLVLLRGDDQTFVPVALFPPTLDAGYLSDTAQAALDGAAGVRRPQPDGSLQVAYPLRLPAADAVDERPTGDAGGGTITPQAPLAALVLLHLRPADEAALSTLLADLHWGAGWLAEALAREQQSGARERLDHAGFLLDLQAGVLAQPDRDRALFELVNRLSQHLGCHQVLFGAPHGHGVRVQAMSHAAWFDERSGLLQQATQAMHEAFDQRLRTVVPADDGPAARNPATATTTAAAAAITTALRTYAADSRSAAACALPLENRGELAGVCLLQRDAPFTPDELRLLDMVAVVLGPPLALLDRQHEGLWTHARRSGRTLAGRLVDGSHPGWKLGGVALAVLLALAALWPVDYRVSAKAVLEGEVQQAAVAPFAGFIRQAPARAGDMVKRGQVLAVLDDKDLRLEADRWQAELQIAEKRERESRANGERAELRLASAQAAQARAQLQLAQDKLARVQVVAPFDGVIVRGDLSQQIGSPVEVGKLLFELAPLATWRVIVQVDERDIGNMAEGQRGELVLTSLTGRAWPLQVRRITPVAVADEGRNHFRVEAALLDGAAPGMRPGMEGVAKVQAGERSLLWIWTHRFTDWLRLAWWRWWL